MEDFDQNVPSWIYPPLEAFRLFPEGDEVVVGKNKKAMRFIYEGNADYTDFEEDKLQAFERHLASLQIEIPSDFSRSYILRWFSGVHYDTSKGVKALKDHFQWRQTNIPKPITSKIKEILEQGYFYVHGRDYRYRPLLVWNARLVKKLNVDEMIEGVVYVLNYVIKNMFIPGQVENWVSIMDASKLGLNSFPRKRLQPCIGTLQNNFRSRQFHISILNAGAGMRFLYALASPFLQANVRRKLSMHKTMLAKQLIASFNPLQLEQRFGGQAPNMESFWPPICIPDAPFQLQKTPLLPPEEYVFKLKSDSRIVRPPRNREVYQDIRKPIQERIDEKGIVLPLNMTPRAPPAVQELKLEEEDDKSEFVQPALKDEEGKDVGKQEGIINPDVLIQVLEEQGNVDLEEGDVEVLRFFIHNPLPKSMSHAKYYNKGVSGPFGRGHAMQLREHNPDNGLLRQETSITTVEEFIQSMRGSPKAAEDPVPEVGAQWEESERGQRGDTFANPPTVVAANDEQVAEQRLESPLAVKRKQSERMVNGVAQEVGGVVELKDSPIIEEVDATTVGKKDSESIGGGGGGGGLRDAAADGVRDPSDVKVEMPEKVGQVRPPIMDNKQAGKQGGKKSSCCSIF